ncbi:hypothetical protein OIU74_025422 [Salix koriyanagi]|uniref:Uncharacterized protein n=1 Tax=Salix koriyanagi TaxID=2511006 RepID=A0A9Q0W174_9ROSI|nr:hypothetical protein OIU74_025422 [Salix koriyanagi]
MRLEQREARKQLRRQIYGWSGKQKQIEEQQEDLNPNNWGGNSHDISNNQSDDRRNFSAIVLVTHSTWHQINISFFCLQ